MADGTIVLRMRFQGSRVRRQLSHVQRRLRRIGNPYRPEDWLAADPPTFFFPSWCPRWRPYDHTQDPDQLERIA